MNKIFNNIVTNYHLTDGGSEFYATTEADEVVKFQDKNGNIHNCQSIRIDSDGTDLLIQLARVDSDGSVLHTTDTLSILAGSYISFDNVRFNAVKVLGALGQNIKFTGLY
jgi:hypothetical protein